MSTELLSSFDDALKQYKTDLSNHDWYYCHSDDGVVYSAGRNNGERLYKLAEENGIAFKIAYNEEHSKQFNNEVFYAKDDRSYVPPFKV
jgi:hypothetical protein